MIARYCVIFIGMYCYLVMFICIDLLVVILLLLIMIC